MPNLRNAKLIADRRQRAGKQTSEPSQETLASPADAIATDEPDQQDEVPLLLKLNVVTEIESLTQLPHIGESRARTLLKNRADGYTDLADLKARSGVSLTEAQWQELEPLLDFERPTQE